ncbi:MAG: putative Ankyrin repeat protein [Candidatus Midichloria mitochondrii]|uniref:Predicted Ankyrin repeat protein n=1 Tax=Midichloria mitochondrii (strain IricVA) TaxID=696127 RepID=F7XUJ7_MIDMI|nr:predicted Ankyrin repeat protein [Candidatus Midichloria mitochondrii IricVA]
MQGVAYLKAQRLLGSSKVSRSYDYKDFRTSNAPVGILIKNRGGVLDENMKLLNSLIDEEPAGNQEKIINSLSKALSNGAVINYQNNFGKTALYLAVHNGHDRVVKWLIKKWCRSAYWRDERRDSYNSYGSKNDYYLLRKYTYCEIKKRIFRIL